MTSNEKMNQKLHIYMCICIDRDYNCDNILVHCLEPELREI